MARARNKKRTSPSPPARGRGQSGGARKSGSRRGKGSGEGARAKAGGSRPDRRREVVGIVGLGLAVFVGASLLSLQVGDGRLMGPLGRASAAALYGLLGVCSYLAVGVAGALCVRLLTGRRPVATVAEASATALALAALTALAHLAGGAYRVAESPAGGSAGAHLAETSRALVSTPGTVLLAAVALFVAAIMATPLRAGQVWAAVASILRAGAEAALRVAVDVGRFCGEVIRAILPERDRDDYLDDEDDDDEDDDPAADLDFGDDDPPIIESPARAEEAAPRAGAPEAGVAEAAAAEAGVPEAGDVGDTERLAEEEIAEIVGKPKKRGKSRRGRKAAAEAAASGDAGAAAGAAAAAGTGAGAASSEATADPGASAAGAPAAGVASADAGASQPASAGADAGAGASEPAIVESAFMNKRRAGGGESADDAGGDDLEFIPLAGGEYTLPPLRLLREDPNQTSDLDRQAMLELSAKLAQTLENYGVKGQVTAIRPGPVVTMYEFSPAPGTRIQKITNLSDDLAMALEALRVRIVAPIPGKAAVGIEVPNKTRETVFLKEILADDAFQSGKHALPLAMGKDIEGAPAVVDLARMPHLLVAGTTGSGKSVSVNAMITSLLYSASPEDVRVMMVDPKMLELSIYEGIPHLLLPVVTDPQKANLALRWAVEEMERRYDLLAKMGVRDITSYNRKVEKQRRAYEEERARRRAEAAAEAEGGAGAGGEGAEAVTEEREHPEGDLQEPPSALPYLVIVIDEFADLMMCAPKEVESSVARIAQKARAAGIHLILATQRPSVDVITGLIKANFPSRCAFHVTSKTDSRTVLDQGGAEALLGLGDMLFSDRGGAPKRYHGCFVDEDEVHEVVSFLKSQARPVYNMEILKPREDEGGGGEGEAATDEMYDRAVQLVAETRQASISMIQRRLRVGYNRAARMVEQMEREGVVGPPDGTNKREVLISAA